ncbi:uncharacterized protein [Ptychodera flava]|uniref:uncharacterized protein n=1 Tax=Ptychodera flava TaxID=63121 RepID=UPI00396A7D21
MSEVEMDLAVSETPMMEQLKSPRHTSLSGDIDRFTKNGNEDLAHGRIKQAVEAFEQAYKRAEELDEGYALRGCAFNLGAVYIATGHPQRGIELLRKAVPPENTKDGSSNGDLFYNFGLAHDALHNYNEAIQNYEKAIDEYQKDKNVSMEAETHCKLASVYQYLQKYPQAEKEFGKAADKYLSLQEVFKQTSAMCNRGNCLLQTKDVTLTTKVLDDCLELCGQQEQTSKLGKVYHDVGLGYVQLKDFNKAVQCFELALPLFREPHKNQKKEAVILQNLGAVYNSLGDFQRAISFHEKAAALHNALGDRTRQGQCFNNLAFAFSQLGDYESAGESYLHALQAAKDTGDKRAQWQAYEGLAAVNLHRGETEKAIALYKQALTLAAQIPNSEVAQERLVGKLSDAIEYQLKLSGSHRHSMRRRAFLVSRQSSEHAYLMTNRGTMTSPDRFIPRIVETQASVIEISRPLSKGRSRRRKRFGLRHRDSSDEDNFKTVALGVEEYDTDSDLSLINARSRSQSESSKLEFEKEKRIKTKKRLKKRQDNLSEEAVAVKSEMQGGEIVKTEAVIEAVPKAQLVADYKDSDSDSDSSSENSSFTSVTNSANTNQSGKPETTPLYSTIERTAKQEAVQADDEGETATTEGKTQSEKLQTRRKHRQRKRPEIESSSSSDSTCDTTSESETESDSTTDDEQQGENPLYETLEEHQNAMASSIPVRDPPPVPTSKSSDSEEPPPLPRRQYSSKAIDPFQGAQLAQMSRAEREKALYEIGRQQSEQESAQQSSSSSSDGKEKTEKTKSRMCIIM